MRYQSGSIAQIRMVQYKEAYSSIRFYANIRYLLMPIFGLATGAVFVAVFAQPSNPAPDSKCLLKLFGVYLGFAFAVLEVVLNRYIYVYADIIVNMEKTPTWFRVREEIQKRIRYRGLVPALIAITYAIVGAFWAFQLSIGELERTLAAVCAKFGGLR